MNFLCRFLEWDSDFFQRRIGKIDKPALTVGDLGEIEAWGRAEGIECLYFLADADDATSIRLAEENGFRLKDIRLSLEHILANNPGPGAGTLSPFALDIRKFQAGDLSFLKACARENHAHTRFFRDANFPKDRAADLYATWLENSCLDPETAVMVAVLDGIPAGYLSAKLASGKTGEISLAGVDVKHRGLGVGTRLVREALEWFQARGASRCSVVTQGANIPAQRLYVSNGFYPKRVQLWYHKWFP